MATDVGEALPLAEAMIQWTDPALVQAVRAEEQRFTAYELGYVVHRPKLSALHQLAKPNRDRWMIGQPDFTRLIQAWRDLERDFRARTVRGAFYLEGVQIAPEPTTRRQVIPSPWIAECDFDLLAGAVVFGSRKFAAVKVWPGSEPADDQAAAESTTPVQGTSTPTIPEITAQTVRQLTDEEILLLLEEHARRVIEGPNAKLIAPGKISLMPIVAGKMRRRAEQGELLPKISEESLWLAKWIASKVALHQVPTAGTIGKVLAAEYAVLKTRSSAAIQSSKA